MDYLEVCCLVIDNCPFNFLLFVSILILQPTETVIRFGAIESLASQNVSHGE